MIALEINTTIAVLNLICIMNREQYYKIFSSQGLHEKTKSLLDFLSGVFEVYDKYPNHQMTVPSILKAAVIKTFGYLIQHQKSEAEFTQSAYVCNKVLGHCLS